ncbi:MAG: transporter substrate-binding domain-containing protein, partial [Gammaproteobacteria bacterium]|nr:transporter substrate-binding domain-containing protein [Gammaproteobacteria bacterium]
MYACFALAENSRNGLLLCLLGLVLLAACGDQRDGASEPRPASINYLETGDLDALNQRGRLRILILNEADDQSFLPRAGSMRDFELRFASQFAHNVGLEPVIIYVDRVSELIPALREGRGDLIAANLSVTDERKALIEFTVPLLQARQVVLKRKGDDLSKRSQLDGRSIAIRRST